MGRLDQGAEKSAGRYAAIPRVLCFVRSQDQVLLLRGAPTKRIWPNLLNGVGGHVERGEDIYGAALREIAEETGLRVERLRLRALVNIDSAAAQGILMFVFTAWSDSRAVVPCAEGALEWWPCGALPAEDLVEDLAQLLPRVLAMGEGDAPLSARYWYDEQDRLRIEIRA